MLVEALLLTSIVDAYFFLPKTEPSSTNGGNTYTITNKKRVKWD